MDQEFNKAQVLREVRHPRIVRAQLADLRSGGRNLQDFVIRNISEHGIGGTCKGPAPVRGERIRVIIPGGHEITGEVRWFRDHAFGMQLDEAFDVSLLSQALQQQAHVTRINGEWHVESRHRVTTPQVDPSRIRRV